MTTLTNTSMFNRFILSDNTLNSYIDHVLSIPNLTIEEEYDYIINYQKNNCLSSANNLILAYLKSVVSIAKRYKGYNVSLVDLIQEGTIGLLTALNKFDLNKKLKFYTYSRFWINERILSFIANNWSLIKVTTTTAKKKIFYKLRNTYNSLKDSISHQEKNKECSLLLNVTEKDINTVGYFLSNGHNFLCLDRGANDELNFDYCDNRENILEDKYIENETKLNTHNAIKEAIADSLNDRERYIIENRYFRLYDDQLTFKELSDIFNVSLQRIKQIEIDAIKKIKKFINIKYNHLLEDS